MKKEIRKLTEVELELMVKLWELGEGSASDVQKALEPERKLAYTSVSTVLRILEKKDVVEARKEGRGHIYIPLLSKAEYETVAVDHAVKKIFGTPAAMVRQMLDSGKLTKKDIAELRELLDAKEKR